LVEFDFGLRRRRRDTNAQNVLSSVIERHVFVFLEKANLSNALGGNAAGGEVRDSARFELKTRMSDIDFVRDYRDADGFQVDHRRIDEGEQNVEVVDHHVVNDVDIEAPRREHAQAVNFEKHRARDDALSRDHRGIETLEMADLQNPVATLRGRDQAVGFRER